MREKYYLTVVMIMLITTGCHYGALTKDYGKSYNAVKSGQIMNPGASKNLNPVTGLSGAAADTNMKKYADSFAPSGPSQQQGPAALLMSPISLGAGKDVYGK